MRTVLFYISLSMLLAVACSDSGPSGSAQNKLKFINTEYGGCNGQDFKIGADNDIQTTKKDALCYEVKGDTLTILVGIVGICCWDFVSETEIVGDSINIYITGVERAPCDCICYYEFYYRFCPFDKKSYYCSVFVNEVKKLEGNLDLRYR